jgi:hypothetical protein
LIGCFLSLLRVTVLEEAMRFLTPLILFETFLMLSGTAAAQAPGMDRCAQQASSCPVVARLRTVDSRLAAIVIEASARSRSFRQLAQTIDQTDGIVYVEHGKCGHGVRACLVAVSVAGANRIVRVRVNAKDVDGNLMGSIGHELQHAIEVLGNSKVTDTKALYFFYDRIGIRRGNAFETAAAIQAGNHVRAELRRSEFSTQVP